MENNRDERLENNEKVRVRNRNEVDFTSATLRRLALTRLSRGMK